MRGCRPFALLFCLSLLPIAAQSQTYNFGRTDQLVGPGDFSVATGDFNGDGVVDLVTANQGSNTVSVILGNAFGGFYPQRLYPTGNAPNAVVVADFNHDGNLDLAVTNS